MEATDPSAPVVIRPATVADVPAMAEVMSVEPSRESVALFGSADHAHRFQLELLGTAVAAVASEVRVATVQDVVVGFAVVSDGSDVPPFRQLTGMAVRAMGVVGALRAAWRSSSRLAVDLTSPPGGRHLVELQVDPRWRGTGVGGALLDAVEQRAMEAGWPHLSLTTGITNPARRLYERHGYVVTRERRGRRYEHLTGIPGRVLMVRTTPT